MAPSFLKKRSRPQSGALSPISPSIRPSLSLPDLTTPLIDQSSWEEVPPFVFNTTTNARTNAQTVSPISISPTSPYTSTTSKESKIDRDQKSATIPTTNKVRHKTPSLVGGEGKVQFHKPFTPKMIISPLTPGSASTTGPGPGAGNKSDFRKSTAKWSRESVSAGPGAGFTTGPGALPGLNMNFGLSPSNLKDGPMTSIGESRNAKKMRDSMMSMITRRKGRKKGVNGELNIVVAGGKGVGKTSFVNTLLSSLSDTPSSITSTLPTLKPKAHMALSSISDRLLLRLIDTPGLDLALSDELKAKERERGVAGLIRMVEDRFEEVWREERKVRRQVGAEEGLVHLVLYLIDAREILHPQLPRLSDEVDWSCLGLFDDDEPGSAREALGRKSMGPTSNEPRISPVEIDILKRLSARSNVLPILTHSDQLSVQELEKVKEAMRRNLASVKAGLPGKGFGVFGSSDEESRKSIDSVAEAMDLDSSSHGFSRTNANANATVNNREAPPTPDSLHSDSVSDKLPYAIFTPDSFSFSSFKATLAATVTASASGPGSATSTFAPDFSAPPPIPPVPPLPELSIPIVKAVPKKTPVHVPRPLYPNARAAARPKTGTTAASTTPLTASVGLATPGTAITDAGAESDGTVSGGAGIAVGGARSSESMNGSVSGSIRSHKSNDSNASSLSNRGDFEERLKMDTTFSGSVNADPVDGTEGTKFGGREKVDPSNSSIMNRGRRTASVDLRPNQESDSDHRTRIPVMNAETNSNSDSHANISASVNGTSKDNANANTNADALTNNDVNTGPSRQFPWGKSYINNPAHSDFTLLKEAILGDHARILRNTTREVLYEKYRTEKLLSRRGTQLPEDERDRIVREIMKV